MHDVPYLFGLQGIGERWHRCAIQTIRQIAEHSRVGVSALQVRSACQIEWTNRISLAISESSGRWTVATAFLAMTEDAVHALKKFAAPFHALRRIRRLRGNLHRWSRLLFCELRRKTLYVCHQVDALLSCQRFPRRHATGMNAAADRVV